jgi:CheY-like chemotaxis protein
MAEALRRAAAGLGQGSEFIVRLPLEPSMAADPSASPIASRNRGSGGGLRILVADDNVDSAESLALLLHMHGHEVRTAHSGRQALAAAADFRPRVLLLDIGMPDLNGYEVARRLREQSLSTQPILIAVSGWGQEEDKRRTAAAGFAHHLTKPLDPEHLESLLGSLREGVVQQA